MDRRGLRFLGALAACLALAQPATAGLTDDVPSCYLANRITPAQPPGYTRLIYLLIDQTVGWNAALEQAIEDNLNANLLPGTEFTIATFSAFSQGRYLEILHTGIIEAPMPQAQIDETPIEKTKIFDTCLADQWPYATRLADRSLGMALRQSSASLDHSDIMSALQAVSAAIAGDPAPRKLLFLASDGLENSAVTSFYRAGRLRVIDPQAELRRAAKAGLFGDFKGSRVYVIGGALPDRGSDYQSPQKLEALRRFWQLYFQHSNADLVAFGEPALLEPVGF